MVLFCCRHQLEKSVGTFYTPKTFFFLLIQGLFMQMLLHAINCILSELITFCKPLKQTNN